MIPYEEAIELTMHVLYDVIKGYQVSGKAIVANHSRLGVCVVSIDDFSIETREHHNKASMEVRAWILPANSTERLWISVFVDYGKQPYKSKLEYVGEISNRLKHMIQTIPDTELGRVLYHEGGTD